MYCSYAYCLSFVSNILTYIFITLDQCQLGFASDKDLELKNIYAEMSVM